MINIIRHLFYGVSISGDDFPDFPPDNPVVPTPTPSPTPSPDPLHAALVEAINNARTHHGKTKLTSDPKLCGVAQTWADNMATKDSLYHGNFSTRLNSVYPNTASAENIAWNAQTVDGVVQMWMLSLFHRINMLGGYNIIGTGIAKSQSGSLYWCTDFSNV